MGSAVKPQRAQKKVDYLQLHVVRRVGKTGEDAFRSKLISYLANLAGLDLQIVRFDVELLAKIEVGL